MTVEKFETATKLCEHFKEHPELTVEEMNILLSASVINIMAQQIKHTKDLISEVFDETLNMLECALVSLEDEENE